MRVKISLNKILWILPFMAFILGYYFLHCFLQNKVLIAPNIIGKTLQVSMNVLSEQGLSLRLLREQEDPDLPEGIILDQLPKPDQKIRPNQHIFVTISKKPKAVLTPDFLGQDQKFINTKSVKMGMQARVFWMKSNYPLNTCIGQYPESGSLLDDRKCITYLSRGNQSLFIVPSLKDLTVCQVKESLSKENIKLDILHSNKQNDGHNCVDCKVVDQKPMPGSIVDLSKKLYMQVQVV